MASETGWRGALLPVAALLVLALLPAVLSPCLQDLVLKIAVSAIFALSLELPVGRTGLVSLGHAAFLGIGAYVTVLGSADGAASLAWLLPAAVGAAAACALAGGSDGIFLYDPPVLAIGGRTLLDLGSKQQLYFTILAGLAGCLLAVKDGAVNPELMSWHQSGAVLLMLILGGIGSLRGAVIGALAFTLLTELFQSEALLGPLAGHWQPTLGLTIIAFVALLPRGIAGLGARRG